MSADLGKTVDLLADNRFRERVKAAMLEQAKAIIVGDTTSNVAEKIVRRQLALSVVADSSARVGPFLQLVADDVDVSGALNPAAVTDAQIRSVVTAMWSAIAAATPNLGS
jgi:hypothetical protein